MWTVFWTVFLVWIIGMAVLPMLRVIGRRIQFLGSDEGKKHWEASASMNRKETREDFNRRMANWERDHEAKGEHSGSNSG